MNLDDQWKPEKSRAGSVSIKTVFGYIFLAIGAVALVFIFLSILNLFKNPEKIMFLRTLLEASADFEASFGRENLRVSIPPEFFSMIVFLFMLVLLVKIAIAFLQTGGRLLYGDFQKLMLKFNEMDKNHGTLMNGLIHETRRIKEKLTR